MVRLFNFALDCQSVVLIRQKNIIANPETTPCKQRIGSIKIFFCQQEFFTPQDLFEIINF